MNDRFEAEMMQVEDPANFSRPGYQVKPVPEGPVTREKQSTHQLEPPGRSNYRPSDCGMPPSKLFLVRHGWAEHNVEDDYTLRDPKLTPTGQEEARCLGRELEDLLPADALVVSSPLRRTVETALIAFPSRRVLLVPDLQECSASPCVRILLALKPLVRSCDAQPRHP
jgi:hypothetical protein